MPYVSTQDLPPSVRRHIADERGRRLFIHVFNSAWDRGAGESSAFRQAWASLKRAGWHRCADGMWRDGPPPTSAPAQSSHQGASSG